MRIILTLVFIACFSGLYGQQVVATAGSTLNSVTGTMSYTIGEGITQTLSQGDKAITQGFHQTYISVSMVSELKDIDFSISVFPNPATDVLTLKVSTEKVSGMQYLLFDLNGTLLTQAYLKSSETIIPVNQLVSGMFIIKVQAGQKELKSFKIIKY